MVCHKLKAVDRYLAETNRGSGCGEIKGFEIEIFQTYWHFLALHVYQILKIATEPMIFQGNCFFTSRRFSIET